MLERRFHLGIDYGTCSSKLVLRDFQAPGGEKAYAVNGRSFRISSSVGITPSELVFGQTSSEGEPVCLDSLKMRMAGFIKNDYSGYYFGPLTPLPSEFSEKALVTLTLWYLISQGHKAATRLLSNPRSEFAVGITLGIPTSFLNDHALATAFLDAARTAYELYRGVGIMKGSAISRTQALGLLGDAKQRVQNKGPVAPDQVRDWIRSEAEAALFWPFLSPSVADGPYAKVDIGAGTTNASFFRIAPSSATGQWVKDRIVFFGACSGPVGMDAVDAALASHLHLAGANCLQLRGREDMIMQTTATARSVSAVFEQIMNVRISAWQRATPKLRAPAEQSAWRKHKLFIIGGGSTVKVLCEYLKSQRVVAPSPYPYQQVGLEQPTDLYIERDVPVAPEVMPFLSVAHGLSYPSLAIPEVDLPRQVRPMDYNKPSPRKYNWWEEPEDWRMT